jgi:hypothetical protein
MLTSADLVDSELNEHASKAVFSFAALCACHLVRAAFCPILRNAAVQVLSYSTGWGSGIVAKMEHGRGGSPLCLPLLAPAGIVSVLVSGMSQGAGAVSE